MPQDTDSSSLIALLWAGWIYLNIYWWLEYLSSLGQAAKNAPWRPSVATPDTAHAEWRPVDTAVVPPHLEALATEILRRDGTRRIDEFLSSRLAAYEAIVTAFDLGDRALLRKLVSSEVYDVFSDAITEREARRQNIETVFSQIDPPEIVGGLIDEAHMEIAVQFASECFKLSRDTAGELIEGSPCRCRNIDIWTFARPLSSGENAWRVVATEAGG